jgi:phosphosulfolactate synthase (CoM biosynthesis protein A)
MTIKIHVEEILKKYVKPRLDRGDDFVLEEDRDSGHGIGSKSENAKDNIVQE